MAIDVTRLSKALALYAVVFGGVTVGLAYGLTHSGALIVGLAALGFMCIVLGGGAAGQNTVSSAGGWSEEGAYGLLGDDSRIFPGSASSDLLVSERLLFYGFGLFCWSVTVVVLFPSRLQ